MVAALLVKATLVMAVAAGVNAVIGRRLSAATRHLAWVSVVAVLLLPAAAMVLPHWQVDVPGPDAPAIAEHAVPVNTPAAVDPVASNHPSPALHPNQEAGPLLSGAPLSRAPWPGMTWSRVVFGGYLAGLVLLLLRLVADWLQARRIVAGASEITDGRWTSLLGESSTRVRLLRTTAITMPMAVHAGGPAILIPAAADGWSADRRRAVLRHELAHVVRRDCATQALTALASALYWPHPGVWWIARRIRAERELACDDRVLAGGTDAREYAEHLLEIAYATGRPAGPRLAVAMASRSQLEGRMLAVLDAARNRTTPAVRSCAIGLGLFLALTGGLATLDARVVPGIPETAAAPGLAAPVQASSRREGPITGTGTWAVRSGDTNRVQVTFGDGVRHTYGTTMPLPANAGVAQLLSGPGGTVQFTIRRDAGTFSFDGVVRSGAGGGTVTFTPDASFAARLAQRGLARPTEAEVQVLALEDVGVAYLDELQGLGYARPDLPLLMRAAEHGVDRRYLRGMADAGYKLGTLDTLIGLRDHGVDPEYIRMLARQGLQGLPPQELQRARDHGVSPDYIAALSQLGYRNLSITDLVQLRDHGVDPSYIRELETLGLRSLSRDDLIQLRNHGVDPAYVRAFRALGYTRLSVADLVTLRNAGVSPERADEANRRGGTRLSVDDLRRLANRGWRMSWLLDPHPAVPDREHLVPHSDTWRA